MLMDIDLTLGYRTINEYSSTLRKLLNIALQISIFALDYDTIHEILTFSKNYLLILTLEADDLDMLILTESFSTF